MPDCSDFIDKDAKPVSISEFINEHPAQSLYTIFSLILLFSAILGGLFKLLIEPIFAFSYVYIDRFWINISGTILILATGIVLYFFREKRRIYYGILEVSFALASGWYGVYKMVNVGYVEVLSVLAAIYLVVRGIDNIFVGREAQKKIALAKQI